MGTNKIICALCKEEKEPKSNTHYLTDSIIRTCLNENGKNTREKGFFFDFSNPAIHYGFQRNTNSEKFIFKIFNNEEREIFNRKIQEKNVESFTEYYSSIFNELHIKCFLEPAPLYLIKEFFKYLKGEENLTHKNMQTLMTNFIIKKYNITK